MSALDKAFVNGLVAGAIGAINGILLGGIIGRWESYVALAERDRVILESYRPLSEAENGMIAGAVLLYVGFTIWLWNNLR